MFSHSTVSQSAVSLSAACTGHTDTPLHYRGLRHDCAISQPTSMQQHVYSIFCTVCVIEHLHVYATLSTACVRENQHVSISLCTLYDIGMCTSVCVHCTTLACVHQSVYIVQHWHVYISLCTLYNIGMCTSVCVHCTTLACVHQSVYILCNITSTCVHHRVCVHAL